MTMSIATWNVAWSDPKTDRGRAVRARLESLQTEVLCITEGRVENLPADGHVIVSEADYGYPIHEGRRKVLLWSRQPWTHVDAEGHPELPGGRFVAGTTVTSIGSLRIVGVCIPWRDAHVRGGQRNRQPWEDHLRYLETLRRTLSERIHDGRLLVLGDYNQRIPRKWTPTHVHDALQALLGDGLCVATAGQIDGLDNQVIDHIAHTHDLIATDVYGWPGEDDIHGRLSDHSGVAARIEPTAGEALPTPRSSTR